MLSNSVTNGIRTVVLTRSLQGLTSKHYTFSPQTVGTINFISAVGSSQVLPLTFP